MAEFFAEVVNCQYFFQTNKAFEDYGLIDFDGVKLQVFGIWSCDLEFYPLLS